MKSKFFLIPRYIQETPYGNLEIMTESQVVANEIERVLPKVPTLFDRDDVFYSSIEKRDVEIMSARDMRIPLELRPGGQFGQFDSDGGDLGVGDGPTFDKAVTNVVYLKHAIQWTKKAEWATDEKRKAVISTFRHLMATSMNEFRRNVDSVCMTAGNGVLGTITSFTTGGGTDVYTLTTDGYGARLLRFGMPISVYSSDLLTQRVTTVGAFTNTKITFYDGPNKQVKCLAFTAVANGDKIVIAGVTGATPVSMNGVPYHNSNASSGTWLGFDRSLTPEIRANRVNAAGSLALPHARLALNKIGDRVGIATKFKPIAWMHPCQKQAYEELGMLVSVIQKSAKDEALDLYFGDNMQLAGASIKTSYSWDKTRIDFMINEYWGRAELHPAKFYEVEGRKIFELRGTSGGVATSMIFYLVAAFNLFNKNPAAASYIDGLTVPAGY